MKRPTTVWMSSLVLAMAAGHAAAQPGGGGATQDRPQRGRGMMSRDDGAPKLGDQAPTFKLKSLDGKEETDLATFRGKKPVVLFFGSYT